jgi:hypothetical protein
LQGQKTGLIRISNSNKQLVVQADICAHLLFRIGVQELLSRLDLGLTITLALDGQFGHLEIWTERVLVVDGLCVEAGNFAFAGKSGN